ncbi:MAG: prepilin-type N-terminal cleavage/methylation domain-containing protein [Rubrivivax sp.]
MNASRPSFIRRQSGLSLVELLVGVTVGLFVVAAASTLLALQLSDNRRLLQETQVQQDLRATADIIGRELRRAGAWGGIAAASAQSVWRPDFNLSQSLGSAVSPAAGSATQVNFISSRTQGILNYGFKLEQGVIKTFLAGTGVVADQWQELTDPATMTVTRFLVTAQDEPPVTLVCQRLCAGGGNACWPRVDVRSFVIDITAQAANQPPGSQPIVRTVRSVVKIRNDQLVFNVSPTQSCPT